MAMDLLSWSTGAVFGVFQCLEAPADLARSACVARLWRDVSRVPQLWHALLAAEHAAAARPAPSRGSCAGPATCSRGGASRSAPHNSNVVATPLCELLQPPCDMLGRPAAQLRRWLGIRSLQQRPGFGPPPAPAAALPPPPPPALRRLDGVRGSRATYDTATQTLVVFDQRQQRLAFVPLDRAAAEAARHHRWAANGKGGWREVPVPPMLPRHLKMRQQQARELASSLGRPAADHIGGSTAVEAGGHAEEATPEEGADLGGSGLDVLVSCAGDSSGAGGAPGGGTCRGATCGRRPAPVGSGYVASGHPDGRVLVWDVSREALMGRLPSIQGCGRGPVLALAAAAMLPQGSFAPEGAEHDYENQGDEEEGQEGEEGAASADATSRQATTGAGVSRIADRGSSGTSPCMRRTLLAVAYREEVLVWSVPLPPPPATATMTAATASGVRGAPGAAVDVAARLPHARLEAIIKPTLDTAVRSMALSGRHGVLALRSADGVELRSVRRLDAGRWLHGFRDRRNTALLVLGELLFVAASSPAFMMASASATAPPPPPPPTPAALLPVPAAATVGGVSPGPAAEAEAVRAADVEAETAARPLGVTVTNGDAAARAAAAAAWSCDFQVEVSAVDLGALVARCAAGGGGSGDSGRDSGGVGVGAEAAAAAAPAANGQQEEDVAAVVGSGPGPGSGRSSTTFSTPSAEPGERPVVVRTTSPAQRCRLTTEEAARILWDQPLQVCATGGFLVVRCLQFDAAPVSHHMQRPAHQAQLLWPGLFAFPMGDLVAGLRLTGRLPPSHLQHQPRQHSQQSSAGRLDGAQAEAREAAAQSLSARTTRSTVPPGAGTAQPGVRELQLPAEVGAVMRQAGAYGASGAPSAADHRLGTGGPQFELQVPPHVPAAPPSSPPPRPHAEATAGVLISRTVQPCVLLCNHIHVGSSSSASSGSSSAAVDRLPPSLQLLATPRCLALVTPGQEVWLQPIPYAQPQRDEERIASLGSGV